MAILSSVVPGQGRTLRATIEATQENTSREFPLETEAANAARNMILAEHPVRPPNAERQLLQDVVVHTQWNDAYCD